jgi:hypothetical protein
VAEEADPSEEPSAAPLVREDLRGRTRSFSLNGETIGLVTVVALGILMVGFILGRTTAPESEADADADSATPTSADPAAPFPEGDVDRVGYWGFASIEPAIIDTFARPDNPNRLGAADTGQAWRSIRGRWGIQDEHAELTPAGDGAAPSIAVVEGGNAERLTEVTFLKVVPGAGLVFRFRDAQNYWAVVAGPDGASWSVLLVQDGQTGIEGTLEVPATDGATVSVAKRERGMQFLVDGEFELQVNNDTFGDEVLSGLLAAPGTSAEARWDRFYVGDLPPEG